ncbi:MAG: hypothetical protein AB8B95_01235 [Pseudohongiellaceae bacterium]
MSNNLLVSSQMIDADVLVDHTVTRGEQALCCLLSALVSLCERTRTMLLKIDHSAGPTAFGLF